MSGIANGIDALTEPGDAILVQVPAYPPLLSTVRIAGRRLVEYAPDIGSGFEDLEAAVRMHRVKLLILCHPHNPTGRLLDEAALRRLATIILDNDLMVISDEIHADLMLDGATHIPLASLGPDIAACTVTLNGPSKAFNVAGLRLAVCVASPKIRARLAVLPPTRWDAFSTLGVRAALAAWSDDGEEWLVACTDHLARMRALLTARLPQACPGLLWRPPQAGYLAWLDCRALRLPGEPAPFFLDEARVALSPGLEFGTPGRGHVRLNFATSEAILTEIVDRMGAAWRRGSRPTADPRRPRPPSSRRARRP